MEAALKTLAAPAQRCFCRSFLGVALALVAHRWACLVGCHALPRHTKLLDDMPGSSTLAGLHRIRWVLSCTQMVVGALIGYLAMALHGTWAGSALIIAIHTVLAASLIYRLVVLWCVSSARQYACGSVSVASPA
jgi:hypothetical protein